METVISMLRGINVSGKNKISMVALKALYEGLKFKQVTTYIQSGNIVFTAAIPSNKTIANKIEKAILKEHKLTVPVITRTVEEVKAVIKHNPFLKEKGIDITRLYVTFLADIPAKENVDKIKDLVFGIDRFIITGKEIYLYCPVSYGESKLNNNYFENKLKVTATTRNWRTVNELLKMGEKPEASKKPLTPKGGTGSVKISLGIALLSFLLLRISIMRHFPFRG